MYSTECVVPLLHFWRSFFSYSPSTWCVECCINNSHTHEWSMSEQQDGSMCSVHKRPSSRFRNPNSSQASHLPYSWKPNQCVAALSIAPAIYTRYVRRLCQLHHFAMYVCEAVWHQRHALNVTRRSHHTTTLRPKPKPIRRRYFRYCGWSFARQRFLESEFI